MASIDATTAEHRSLVIHPLWVRVTHWINAIAMLVMIGSGWQIYNASPMFDFTLSGLHHARRLARRRAALALRGDVAAGDQRPRLPRAGMVTGRFRRKLLPIRPREVIADLSRAGGRLAHDDLSTTTPCSAALSRRHRGRVVIVLSGLAIWKPVQFQWLTALFGGYDAARYVHFFCMAAIVGFLVVHVLLALIVPKSLRAMITGR